MKTIFKHTLLSLALLAGALTAHAQVKIGDSPTTINGGSVLELQSTNKGLLMPRISLANTTTWGLAGTPATGMHVYNTNTGITSTNPSYPTLKAKIGEYYWDGTGWVALAPQSGASSLIYAGFRADAVFIPVGSAPINQLTIPSYDPYGAYSGGSYTIPVTGWYVITQMCRENPTTYNSNFNTYTTINGDPAVNSFLNSLQPGAPYPVSSTLTLHLNQGDVVGFKVNICSGCTASYTMTDVYQTITTFQ